MGHLKIVGYVVGCAGLLTVGAALAKGPAQTPAPSASAYAPLGCVDSPRGRTHVLRFCGDKHYWIKTATAATPFTPANVMPSASYAGNSPDGPAQNWGGFQRY
jgi:hypothetical protein